MRMQSNVRGRPRSSHRRRRQVAALVRAHHRPAGPGPLAGQDLRVRETVDPGCERRPLQNTLPVLLNGRDITQRRNDPRQQFRRLYQRLNSERLLAVDPVQVTVRQATTQRSRNAGRRFGATIGSCVVHRDHRASSLAIEPDRVNVLLAIHRQLRTRVRAGYVQTRG